MSLIGDRLASSAVRERAVELLDKAVMTAAEGAVLAIGHESVSVNALAVDWSLVGGYALGGAALSVLLNLGRGGLTGRLNKGKG